ncbi:single-stranded-DNA-specific exonuclease RecJ [Schlesneria paludicola]|uniref:single-stranded-DNA-specific exonuclease RecJ n=1 Tax=Schlesneria paludicola TaxID=360056 RepID=UPI00029A56D9|nr:single-stranded-DNA-specific exonuclease RecJ [Schlesneria paludicola]
MHRTWRIATHDRAYVKDLSVRLKVTALIAQVLVARGHQRLESAENYLAKKLTTLHDPELLPGLSAAADRIVAAVQSKRRITIYGDYDVDGVTATSLLWHCLQLIGAKVDYYIPSRMEEGYGLNCDAIRQLHSEDPTRLLVSVDCGITSCTEAALARELGLELIITDHHTPSETLPEADVLVHPRLPGSYPFGELCGVGVAFKLAWAICARMGDGKRASPRMREFLLSAIGLAAIGTIADVVPLIDENRVLVHFGLASLLDRANPGLQELLKVAKVSDKGTLQAEDIAFAVAPRINAAGRLGQARLAVELLTTSDRDRAVALATYLDGLNKDRQSVERKMLKQAKELVEENAEWADHRALVLSHCEWHPGVIGIVATRVAEHFQRPTIMIALGGLNGFAQGSGRSFAGFNLHSGLLACRDHLETFGGHHAAAGLKIRMDAIDAFRQAFVSHVRENHVAAPGASELQIDSEVQLSDLTIRSVTELERLGPFGAANPRPIFVASNVELASPPKKMGEGERHLSIFVKQYGQKMRGVAFGKGDWADEIAGHGGPISICFQPTINRFQGRESVEFHLIDWQPEHAAAGVAV